VKTLPTNAEEFPTDFCVTKTPYMDSHIRVSKALFYPFSYDKAVEAAEVGRFFFLGGC
jgi:hypothetical protein